MLTECLEIVATLPKPDGRPEFFDFNFDGNTEEEKEKQGSDATHRARAVLIH